MEKNEIGRFKSISMSFFENFFSALVADKDIIDHRMSICSGCEFFNKQRRCEKCGCFMDLKIRIGSSTCPESKW